MTGQIDIYDAFKLDPPEVWSCMKTCARSNIKTDTFPGGRGKRCLYGMTQCGTSGKDMYEKVENNRVHFYCRFYKMKER